MAVIDKNYNNPLYANNNQSNVLSRSIDNIKKQDNLTGKIAENYDLSEKQGSKLRSFLYGVLMSVGFVRGTNHLLQPKQITPEMTATDSFTNSRMYKIGAKADNWGPLKWISRQAGRVKSALKKIPLPQFIKEFGEKYRIGSISTWDTTGMYSIGKHAEAMQEFTKFFSEVSNEAIDTLKLSDADKTFIKDLMKKVRAEKINPVEAYKQLEPKIKTLTAQVLRDISPKTGMFSRLLGTTKDLSLSYNKALALTGTVASGPVGKAFNKFVTLVGEASGGGVLGGKMALFGNAAGLVSGFISAAEAEKGDKLQAFMEDYIGFTLGGYLMSMVIGKQWHKGLHFAEFGMNLAKAKELGSSIGLEKVQRVQDVVIGFNNEIKKAKPLHKILQKFEQGKVVEGGGGIVGWVKRLLKGQVTIDKVNSIIEKNEFVRKGADLTSLYETIKSNVKPVDELVALRNGIKETMKSDITFKSVFKGKNGSFVNRLGRWLTQKPIAAVTRFLSAGKYTLLHPNGSKLANFGRSFKRFGGGIARMALFYYLFLAPIQKGFAKLSHKIFGKPKKSILDTDNENTLNNTMRQQNTGNNQSVNLIDLYTKEIAQNKPNMQFPQPQGQHAINPQGQAVQGQSGLSSNGYDSATYIPNQVLGPESYINPAVTQDFIKRRDIIFKNADIAKANAEELLNKIKSGY